MNWYISKKGDGSMNEKENISSFLDKVDIDFNNFVRADLVHGKDVKIIDSAKKRVISTTDGLITGKNIALGVTVADCLPIYIKSENVTGIIHAGWKSIYKGIIQEFISKVEKIGESPENLEVFIGPSIMDCHYEVGQELINKFSDYPNCFKEKGGKTYLSLQKVSKQKFKKFGVNNIEASNSCTFCEEDFFSYRRDKKLNNMLAVIKPTK